MDALADMAGSTMSLQAVIEDGDPAFSSEDHNALVQVELAVLKP